MALQTTRRIGATITAAGTLTAGQHTPVDATAGPVTVTLPTGVTVGAHLSVEKRDSSSNTVTVSGSIRATTTTIPLGWQYESVTLRYDGTSWIPTEGHKTRAALDAAYTPFTVGTAAQLAPRPAAAFAGDSITNGSNASAGQRFVDLLPLLVGHTTMYPIPDLSETSTLRTSAVYGVPGERSDQILARIPTILATNPGVLIVLAGTNDASQLVPVATFAANIDQIVRLARAAGVPVILGTVPPRSASTAANIRALIPAYNVWLTDYCSRKGIPCARINGALADGTGNLAAAYDSGDGTHPNNAGHLAIAKAYATAYRSMYITAPPVVTTFGLGYNSNPLMNGATDASGYFEMPGGTGTAPTYSVKPADGILTAGQWEEMDFDATASGGQRIYANGPTTTGLATGDKLLFCATVEIIDVAGGLLAAMAAGTGGATVRLMDSNANPLTGDTISFAGTLTPGTIARLYTVPAGVTGLLLYYVCTLPTGQHAKFRIGQWDVINLTKLGLDSLAI